MWGTHHVLPLTYVDVRYRYLPDEQPKHQCLDLCVLLDCVYSSRYIKRCWQSCQSRLTTHKYNDHNEPTGADFDDFVGARPVGEVEVFDSSEDVEGSDSWEDVDDWCWQRC